MYCKLYKEWTKELDTCSDFKKDRLLSLKTSVKICKFCEFIRTGD